LSQQPVSIAQNKVLDQRPIRELLGKVRLRPTVARIHILDCLLTSNAPLTMEDVLRSLLEKDAYIRASTVYRALNDLCGNGLIQRNWINGAHRARAVYFPMDLGMEPGDVHRLMCRRCGSTKEFTDSQLRKHLTGVTGISVLNDPRQCLVITADCLGCSADCIAAPLIG